MSHKIEALTAKINKFMNEIKEIEEQGQDPHSLKEELNRLLSEHRNLTGATESKGLLKGL